MEMIAEWAPKIGASLTLLIGLVGFFKPNLITDGQGIKLTSTAAYSESRVVFGGLHIGSSLVALTLNNPAVYMALGAAWMGGLLARFWSMIVDKTSLKVSMPGIVVDATIGLLFLAILL